MLPPEIWQIIAEILNRNITQVGDSIELTLPHPVRYELIIDKEGNIVDRGNTLDIYIYIYTYRER